MSMALGRSETARRVAYQHLFTTFLDQEFVKQMQQCLQTGTPFGNDRFREQIEQTLGRKVGFSKRGRPK
jgi:putative transposase